MMTSPSTIASPVLARSVRDVVAHQPDLVNEIWCRKIFRHILQVLERHHTLHLPHAPLTADTIGFDAAGDPVLLASGDSGAVPDEADDVQALGAVIHYAITHEPVPATPLRSHAGGYSESLVSAVNRCVAADPRERPQTIDQLRDLLGIVALGPALSAGVSAPLFAQAPPRRGIAALGKWQRWLLIGVACVVLLAAASALWMLLRGTDARDNVVLTLPQTVPPARTLDPNETLLTDTGKPSSAGLPGAAGTTLAGHAPAPGAGLAATRQDAPATGPARTQPSLPGAGAAQAPARADPGASSRKADEPAKAVAYKLLVRPWGTVYVDGAERGVSPPLKRLELSPGKHTVRVVNPNFRDRVLRIEAGKHGAGRIDVDFAASSR